MILFKNKLIGEKRNLAPEDDLAAMMADPVRLQKYALSSLSKQEKLLLLELQRTRQTIVAELNRLDPSISTDSWNEVQDTIASYQSKITRQAVEETIDGKNGRVPLLSGSRSVTSLRGDLPMKGSGSIIIGGGNSSSTIVGSFSLHSSMSPSKYSSVTSEKRNAAVRAAAQIPVTRIRTGIDMLPVLSVTSESSIEMGIRKQGEIRLPVFKLPSIDAARVAELARSDEGIARVIAAVAAAQNQPNASPGKKQNRLLVTDAPIVLRSVRAFRRAHRYQSGFNSIEFTRALLAELRGLAPLELQFAKSRLHITDSDIHDVEDELERVVLLKVNYDESDDNGHDNDNGNGNNDRGDGAGVSVFIKCRLNGHPNPMAVNKNSFLPSSPSRAASPPTGSRTKGMNESPPGYAYDGGLDGLGSVSVVTAGTFESSVNLGIGTRTKTDARSSRVGGGTTGSGAGSSIKSSKRGKHHQQSQSMQASSTLSHSHSHTHSHHPQPPFVSPADLLKVELLDSLRRMQLSTNKVKDGMTLIQELGLGAVNPRARQRLLSVAAERLGVALEKLIRRDLSRGFSAWVLVLSLMRRSACCNLVKRFLSARTFARALGSLAHRCLEKRLVRWINFSRKEGARILRRLQQQAAVVMQRYLRGCMARDLCNKLRENKKYKELFAAVVKIQAQIKGRLVKWKYAKLSKARRQDRAARKLQRVQRGHRARKRVRWLKAQKNRVKAATKIQALGRGRRARLRCRGIRADRHRWNCAIKLQAVGRGFVARRRVHEIAAKMHFERAVRKVQRVWRGAIARMTIHRKKRELREYREMRYRAALDVQRVFRGFRSRMTSRMRQIERERKQRRLNEAATKIQTMCRGFISRYTVRKKRKERAQQMLDDARSWVEKWSEDAEAFYYINSASGETLWEPPRIGYTKVDGSLILATGEVIEDPDALEEAENERKRQLGQVCSECSDRVAIKMCKECGDTFCTPCYRTCHAAGARRLHTHEPLGPLDCSECEMVLAERWCVSCDEAFCDGCWRRVHGRGKRRFHPFSDVSARGKIDSRVFTMDGNEVSQYDASYIQNQQEQAEDDERMYEAEGYVAQQQAVLASELAQWAEYADDAGNPYWYNSMTGVSTYDNPWA